MANNEILPFAGTDTGTNLLTQAEYNADSQRPIGNQPGVARSKLVNKVLRQTSLIASAIAQYFANRQSNDITDSLSAATLAEYMLNAIGGDTQKNSFNSAIAAGTADAITASYTPAVIALTNGLSLFVRATAANTSTTPTFTPNSGTVTAKAIVKGASQALVAGDIAGAGHWLELQYDSTLDRWVLQNPATGTATVTSANDATFADNSSKPASTSWIRGAMSAIATAAGFATSYATNGYIKFPSWLGGFIIQWGTVPFVSSNVSTVNWPVAFPSSVLSVMALNPSVGIVITTTGASATQGNFAISVSGTTNGSYLCVGR